MHWNDWTGGWGLTMMLIMSMFWLIVLGGIIWFLVWAIRRMSAGGTPQQETPIDILNRRYAQGEISREEFERMKRELS